MAGLIFLWNEGNSVPPVIDPSLYPVDISIETSPFIASIDLFSNFPTGEVRIDPQVLSISLDLPTDVLVDRTTAILTGSDTTYNSSSVQYSSSTTKYGGVDRNNDLPPQIIQVGGI